MTVVHFEHGQFLLVKDIGIAAGGGDDDFLLVVQCMCVIATEQPLSIWIFKYPSCAESLGTSSELEVHYSLYCYHLQRLSELCISEFCREIVTAH